MPGKKAWVISVDMGYGHQRAAYPLRGIAYERIITANSDRIVTPKERFEWFVFRFAYETVSRLRSIPLVGEVIWYLYDRIQAISPYYPYRDLSMPNFGSMLTHLLIRRGFIRSIIDYTRKRALPFVSTFFAPAIAAAHAGLNDVYCVVTDTDINRAWVPEHPKKEKIYYLTPTEHSTRRIMAYGVDRKNIFFTGFPLPKENTGRNLYVLKSDLADRLPNLDPKNVYISKYRAVLRLELGKYYRSRSNHPLTLTFCVGGAGAQAEVGDKILKSLANDIKGHKIRLNIVVGTHLGLAMHYNSIISGLRLGKELGSYITIISATDRNSYFKQFNEVLHTTDILWTKPSELSFYTALGLPIIIAPPLGSHEILNEKWLVMMGTGFPQENPDYTNEWLFEWLDKGILAEAAWEGFMEAPKYGTYNIEKLIFSRNKKDVKLKY